MSRRYQVTRPTPLMDSIAVLYALGMTPQPIGARLRSSTGTVSRYLSWLMRYWSAPTWHDAARMHVESLLGDRDA